MSQYLFSIGPYFFSALVIAFTLAVVSVWWNRSPALKATALSALVAFVFLVFLAVSTEKTLIQQVVSDFRNMMQDLLSRPKAVTFGDLQDMLPEGHRGHLILYGETREKEGVYLLLRSPDVHEPRYYLLEANPKLQEEFRQASFEAKKNGTQLWLGGKIKKRDSNGGTSNSGHGQAGEEDELSGQQALRTFHPTPVTGGPEKVSQPQDQPLRIGTPGPSHQ